MKKNQINAKQPTKRSFIIPKGRRGFRSAPLNQKGVYIVLYSGVSKRIATLVRTEAAIHDKSVSAMVNDILEARYSKVK